MLFQAEILVPANPLASHRQLARLGVYPGGGGFDGRFADVAAPGDTGEQYRPDGGFCR